MLLDYTFRGWIWGFRQGGGEAFPVGDRLESVGEREDRNGLGAA